MVEKNDNKQKGAGVGPLKIYKAIAVRCELKQVVTLRLYLLRSVQNYILGRHSKWEGSWWNESGWEDYSSDKWEKERRWEQNREKVTAFGN